MLARLLSVVDTKFFDWNNRGLGHYAKVGLWLLMGKTREEASRLATSTNEEACHATFESLLTILPGVLAKMDEHGLLRKLEELNIEPLCAQNIEHLLCEFQKMLSSGATKAKRGREYEEYAELWLRVKPILRSRVERCDAMRLDAMRRGAT